MVTLFTTEVEYIAAAFCACQSIWIKRIMEILGFKNLNKILILCDSNLAIQLFKNPIFHGRNKHINIRFHFLRDLVKDGALN